MDHFRASPRAHANTLRFFANQAFQEHGWFYHWLDTKTGERRWKSEVSSIDTALLLAGVLTARQYFRDDPEIGKLATNIYERVDFRWMLNGHPLLLSHGWKPETGFLKAALGHLQRRHDSLSAGHRLTDASHLAALMVCVVARSLSLRRLRLFHHDRRAAVHASVRARLD